MNEYQILAFPGGFSFGDDTGSGKAFANKIRNNLWDELLYFIEQDHLIIGICNGFQVMTYLGVLPAINGQYGNIRVALTHNDSARYNCRWVDLEFQKNNSPWTQGITEISLPIAHGEGKFYAEPEVLEKLKQENMIAAKYVEGEICQEQNLPANPNGSLDNIAAITDKSGKLIGMMPHPERTINFTQHPLWTLEKEKYIRKGKQIPSQGAGQAIFDNGVAYFK